MSLSCIHQIKVTLKIIYKNANIYKFWKIKIQETDLFYAILLPKRCRKKKTPTASGVGPIAAKLKDIFASSPYDSKPIKASKEEMRKC